jgi:hypothetical protein
MDPLSDLTKDENKHVTAGSDLGGLGPPIRVFRVNIPNFIAGFILGLLGIAVGLIGIVLYIWVAPRPIKLECTAICVFAFIWFPIGVVFLIWLTRTLFVRILVYDVGFVRTCRGKSDAFFWHEITAVNVFIRNRGLGACVVTRKGGRKVTLPGHGLLDLAGLIKLIKEGTARDADACTWTTIRQTSTGPYQMSVDKSTEVVGRGHGRVATSDERTNPEWPSVFAQQEQATEIDMPVESAFQQLGIKYKTPRGGPAPRRRDTRASANSASGSVRLGRAAIAFIFLIVSLAIAVFFFPWSGRGFSAWVYRLLVLCIAGPIAARTSWIIVAELFKGSLETVAGRSWDPDRDAKRTERVLVRGCLLALVVVALFVLAVIGIVYLSTT